MADRPTWSAGLARSRGRQVDGDGRVEVNLMAAALFLASESVLAAARSEFAEVAVINGTAQQTDPWTQVTTAAFRALRLRQLEVAQVVVLLSCWMAWSWPIGGS